MTVRDVLYYMDPSIFAPAPVSSRAETVVPPILGFYASCSGNEIIVQNVLDCPFLYQSVIHSWVRCLGVIGQFLQVSNVSAVDLLIAVHPLAKPCRGKLWTDYVFEMESHTNQKLVSHSCGGAETEGPVLNSLQTLKLTLLYLMDSYLDKFTVSHMCCYNDCEYNHLTLGADLHNATNTVLLKGTGVLSEFMCLLQALRTLVVIMNESDDEFEIQRQIYRSVFDWIQRMNTFILALAVHEGVPGITTL